MIQKENKIQEIIGKLKEGNFKYSKRIKCVRDYDDAACGAYAYATHKVRVGTYSFKCEEDSNENPLEWDIDKRLEGAENERALIKALTKVLDLTYWDRYWEDRASDNW